MSETTQRKRIRDVFDGHPSKLPPVSIRLDLWRRDAESRGALPDEITGMSNEEVEDFLGFARAARFRDPVSIEFAEGSVTVNVRGDETLTEYRLPGRTLTSVSQQTEANRRAGIRGHVVKYAVACKEDCVALARALESAAMVCDPEGFDELDRAAGEHGLPIHILGACPAHHVMLRFTGYEGFYLQSHDFGDEMQALINALDALMRRDLWPVAQNTRAELVMHGVHFSSAMTPPPIFERFFLPYFTEFNALMRRAGKKALWHSDAEVSGLLRHVLDAGFDAADCLATAPLVPQTLTDYLEAWQGRIVCWGGLPSVIFDAAFPMDDFKRHVDQTARLAEGRADVIIGASDNVMPGAEWERLLYIRDVFSR